MKEVEMKAWLKTDEEIARVKAFLENNAVFQKKVVKKDIYFAKPNAEHFDFRIREIDGRYFVTQKERKLRGNIEENTELEFEVLDGDVFIQLTEKLGYVVFLEKTKISEIYQLAEMTAEILEVVGLGNFLEVEILCEDGEVQKAGERISQLFVKLDLEGNIEKKQYSNLIQKEK